MHNIFKVFVLALSIFAGCACEACEVHVLERHQDLEVLEDTENTKQTMSFDEPNPNDVLTQLFNVSIEKWNDGKTVGIHRKKILKKVLIWKMILFLRHTNSFSHTFPHVFIIKVTMEKKFVYLKILVAIKKSSNIFGTHLSKANTPP